MAIHTIWVDADACPKMFRDILFKAAVRTQLPLVMVANHHIPLPQSSLISQVHVEPGFDVADNELVKRAEPGDLCITQDIPLASELIDKGVMVINTRGEELTRENIRQRLNIRDFMDTMRSSGVQTGGPKALSQQDKQRFANALDRLLTQHRQ